MINLISNENTPKPEETFDASAKNYRRRYSLDSERLCFLSFFLTAQRVLDSFSFDVEAADDYHYQIGADMLPKLCASLGCESSEQSLVKVFAKLVAVCKTPVEIGSIIRNAEVQFNTYSFADYSDIEKSQAVSSASVKTSEDSEPKTLSSDTKIENSDPSPLLHG